LIFAKEKKFFKENRFSIWLIFNYLQVLFARVRSIFAKGLFLKQAKNFFQKKFCSSEKRFYNSHVLESQTNGKQVRRKNEQKNR